MPSRHSTRVSATPHTRLLILAAAMSLALAAIGAPHLPACDGGFGPGSGRRGFDSTRARAAAQAIAAVVRDLRAFVAPAPRHVAVPSTMVAAPPAPAAMPTVRIALGSVLRHAMLDLPPPTA